MKPILFSTPMVQAILDENKTQTRRLIKPQPIDNTLVDGNFFEGNCKGYVKVDGHPNWRDQFVHEFAKYQIDDILWVKETYYAFGEWKRNGKTKTGKLYDWIFYKYAKEGQNILDTHIGSGSIRIAAHKAGLNLIGFEIDTEYYEKQEKRFKDFVSQLRLF